MKPGKQLLLAISMLFALGLSFNPEPVNASDNHLADPIVAASHTSKRQCENTCRARLRDCRRLTQISYYECLGVYQDCMRYTCTAATPG